MANKPTTTSRKSRFEMLEDRRLLTTWNVDAKFTTGADGGEAAFGDNATETAGQLHSTYNNNYGSGAVTVTDAATSASPWTFGSLDSGPVNFSNHVAYSFSAYNDPNSFDNYLTGAANAPWSPGFPGGALDGVNEGYDGIAGFFGGPSGVNSVLYNYGNSGLNGNGSGTPVLNLLDGFGDVPSGTMVMSPAYGPTVSQFTAPTAGNYVVTATLTNPYFDPYDGPGGGNRGNDAWSWDAGQADDLIFKVPAGSTDADNTSTLLASGFYEDIKSITQADIPTPGNSITSSSGIVLNTGTATGAYLNSHDLPGQSYPDTGLPLDVNNGSQATNLYSYGSGGTWSLKNVGAFITTPTRDDVDLDPSGDEYDMTWTFNQTVSLDAGDSIQIVDNPRFQQGAASGDAIVPIYLTASAAPAPPPGGSVHVSTSGSTGQTFTLGGSAVAVDSGISVTASDPDITGASETIANYQSGDSLNYTPIDGITIASNSGGVLNLTGVATPAQYTAALQSVTFSTTSINQTTRTVDVVADDSAASPTTSNTGIDTVNVAIAPPVVTANQTAKASTAGQTVAVDSAVTVKSFDTDVTGATMTIGTGYQSGSDTLHFTTQNGITGVYSAGVLTLSGSATPAQYQTALQSVTFSSTSTSVATRNISIVVDDSGDTGNVNSNTATTQITVSAPLTVTAAYISSTSWASSFDTYLSSHTNAVTGHAYGSSTLGYAFQTGTSAAQTQTLPWTNLNTITVTFSGPVSGVALGSLKLNGGSGGSTPSVTGFTSDGSNTYSWTLSGPLTNNKYAFGIASTSSSYGPAVVDSHGAGISGTFTTGQALPSGNGLAGSSFDFFFDVLPGDANRDAQDNATDINDIRPLASGTRTTSSSYNPYYDLLGAGQINATTLNTVRALTGRLESAAPTNPNSTQGVGTTGFVGLELGAQETGSSSSSSSASTVSNVVSAPASTSTTSTTTSTTESGSGGTSSTTGNRDHGRHAASEGFAATDEAVSDFELTDLYV